MDKVEKNKKRNMIESKESLKYVDIHPQHVTHEEHNELCHLTVIS